MGVTSRNGRHSRRNNPLLIGARSATCACSLRFWDTALDMVLVWSWSHHNSSSRQLHRLLEDAGALQCQLLCAQLWRRTAGLPVVLLIAASSQIFDSILSRTLESLPEASLIPLKEELRRSASRCCKHISLFQFHHQHNDSLFFFLLHAPCLSHRRQ